MKKIYTIALIALCIGFQSNSLLSSTQNQSTDTDTTGLISSLGNRITNLNVLASNKNLEEKYYRKTIKQIETFENIQNRRPSETIQRTINIKRSSVLLITQILDNIDTHQNLTHPELISLVLQLRSLDNELNSLRPQIQKEYTAAYSCIIS